MITVFINELFEKKSGTFFDWLKSINANSNIWEERKSSTDILAESEFKKDRKSVV